jgi:hypothetical protein
MPEDDREKNDQGRDSPMGRLHLKKSETIFNTDITATYFFVVRPV